MTFDDVQDEMCRAASVDAIAHMPFVVRPRNESRMPPAWQRKYEASPGVLFLWGHGDGMHMQLGARALCGIAPNAGDGSGCSYPHECRKHRAVSGVDFAVDAVGTVAFLLSCNSLNLAGQMAPPSLSIARTLVEHAGFSAVIGSARQIAFSQADVDNAMGWWRRGWSVAEIVRALNALPSMPAGLFILGDADLRMHGTGAPRNAGPPPPSPKGARIAELPFERLSNRLDHALTVAALLDTHSAAEQTVSGAVRRQLSLLGAIRRMLAGAHARGNTAEPSPLVADVWSRASAASGSLWDEIVSNRLADSGGTSFGDVFQSILAMGGAPNPSSAVSLDERCGTCGGRVQRNRGSVFSGSAVTTKWCVGCGVSAMGLAAEVDEQSMEFPADVQPGHRASLTVKTADLRGRSTVHIQIRDKSQRRSLVNESFELVGGRFTRTFEIPEDAGPDIGSIRAVVVDGPYISYLRRVFRIGGGNRCSPL